ncbi:MAG: hypothetical protein AB7H93_13305 [Vicinamibacterales bacterium]
MSGAALMLLPEAEARLAAATAVDEVKLLRDHAQTVWDLVKRQRRGLAVQNRVAEFKLRSERKLGNLLADRVEPRGRCLRDETTGEMRGATRTLPEGVTATQAHRWRRAASVPEDRFEAWMAETRERDGELTSAGLLALAAVDDQPEDNEPDPPDNDKNDEGGDDNAHDKYARQLVMTFDAGTHARVVKWLSDLGQEFGTSNHSTTLVALMTRR